MLKLKKRKTKIIKLIHEHGGEIKSTMFGTEKTLKSILKFMVNKNLIKISKNDAYYFVDGSRKRII